MAETINWLHLTDLHLGLDDRAWLWPRVKHDFLRDVEKMSEEIGEWDIVFFTGDLTQKGEKDEFEKLNQELIEIWAVLAKSGRTPVLCVVPGNHDLVRPSSDLIVAKSLTQLWGPDSELRSRFWRESDCECREAVTGFFKHYTNWRSNLPVPSLPGVTGLLPGDFSTTYEKGALRLGIVGLNSTFLQIGSGDFKGKLDMHVSQINAVCGGDTTKWLASHKTNILLTHQPPSWLSPEAFQHFRQEIYPPGRFFAQLCGHQHEPEAFEMAEAGASPRRLRQGPSLFGLENWNGLTSIKRIHGYNAGQFVFEQTRGIERLWPRTALVGRHGGLNLAPDYTYQLQEGECIVVPFDVDDHSESATESNTDSKDRSQASSPEPQTPDSAKESELSLLERGPDEQSAKERLKSCPRFAFATGPQHRNLRLEEQSQFELELRKTRCVWLVADWGSGKEGFLASAIERFRGTDLIPDIFHLRCDDAIDNDALEALFPQQFGLSLQAFCGFVASLNNPFLVLDGIHPQMCTGGNVSGLRRIANAVLDYCSDLRLVFVSRLQTDANVFSTIQLRPLEVSQQRCWQ